MSDPFENETVVNMMEKISEMNENNMVTVVNKMGEIDKERNAVLYYTYDCVLSYITWKKIKDDPELVFCVKELQERVNRNLDIMN